MAASGDNELSQEIQTLNDEITQLQVPALACIPHTLCSFGRLDIECIDLCHTYCASCSGYLIQKTFKML